MQRLQCQCSCGKISEYSGEDISNDIEDETSDDSVGDIDKSSGGCSDEDIVVDSGINSRDPCCDTCSDTWNVTEGNSGGGTGGGSGDDTGRDRFDGDSNSVITARLTPQQTKKPKGLVARLL